MCRLRLRIFPRRAPGSGTSRGSRLSKAFPCSLNGLKKMPVKSMATLPQFTRPGFTEAMNAWKKLLAERQLPADLVWLFDENLCFEKDPAASNGFKLSYQTRLTPPPPDADRVAFNYFS